MVRGGGTRGGGHSSHSHSFGSRSYSNRTSNFNSYGGSYRSSSSDDCDCCDCCSNQACVPSFMASIFFLALLLVPLIWSMLTLQLQMDAGETRIFKYGGSTFVSSVGFVTTEVKSDVKIYFLPPPKLNPAPDRPTYTNNEVVPLGAEEYVNFNHWLNEGSSLDLTFSALTGAVHMYILKSEATWNKWKETFQDGSHYSTYWSKTDIYRYSSNHAVQEIHYHVKEDDLYTMVFVNENWSRNAKIKINYSLKKSNYAVPPNSTPVCGPGSNEGTSSSYMDNDGYCRIPISFKEKNVILLTTPDILGMDKMEGNGTLGTMTEGSDDAKLGEQEFSLGYNCTFRLTYVLYLLVFYLCCCFCAFQGSRARDSMQGLASYVSNVRRFEGYESVNTENSLEMSRAGIDAPDAAAICAITTQPVPVASIVGSGSDSTPGSEPLPKSGQIPSAPKWKNDNRS